MADAEYAFLAPEERFEIIDGVKFMAAAAPAFDHNFIINNLLFRFNKYFRLHKKGVAVQDIDIRLPDGNLFRPDISIISDFEWHKVEEIFRGVPDLVVEVRRAESPSYSLAPALPPREIISRA